MVMSHTFVCKKRSHQARTDRTRCKRIAPEAIRLLVDLMCRTGVFHLDEKSGISVGTKLDFPMGKKLFQNDRKRQWKLGEAHQNTALSCFTALIYTSSVQ